MALLKRARAYDRRFMRPASSPLHCLFTRPINPLYLTRPAMRRVFYCLQFGAPAARHKPIKRAQALPLPAPLPTYCPPCNRALWAILSARGPHCPPCAQAYARAHAPARARVRAPARMTRPLPFCFNSCRQTLPFFAGKRINFCRQTLWFFISPKPS
jgi:hypothetical protein